MHYEIVSALKPGKPLTPAQRASGFSECPRIGSVTLRRGVGLIVNKTFFEANKLLLEHLSSTESIEIIAVDGPKRTKVLLKDVSFKEKKETEETVEPKAEEPVTPAEVPEKVQAPPEEKKAEPAKEPEVSAPVADAVGIANVPAAEKLEYVKVEETPAPVENTEEKTEEHHGKKGKKKHRQE